jgi:hypothetical protein
LEPLEDRRLLAAKVFCNDTWHIETDDGMPGLNIGDVVDDRNDNGGTPTFTAIYGVDAFGVVTTAGIGAPTGSLAGSDTLNNAVEGTDVGGTVHVLAGSFLFNGTLTIGKSVTIDGEGMDVTEIRKSGAPTGNFDEAIHVSAANVTISNVQLGWQDSLANDYQGYVIVTNAGSTTINHVLFGEGYRSAVLFEGADNLEVSDSIFAGLWGRGAIRDWLLIGTWTTCRARPSPPVTAGRRSICCCRP